MNKTTVIYHSADFDGIFCREIARKFLGNEGVEYIGWDFGQRKIPMLPGGGIYYILDLSPECLGGDTYDSARIIWIDHHKSSMEKWPATIPGYRIDGVSACRLAWQWFSGIRCHNGIEGATPNKGHFINRMVSEPQAVRLAGEYDVWDKRDPDAETFQFGLRAEELTDEAWRALLESDGAETATHWIGEMLKDGRLLQRYQQQTDASVVEHRSFPVEFEGLKFIALNTARCNSLTFSAMDAVKPDDEWIHDALMGFYFDGKSWKFSLYHARHNTGIDLSTIAVKYGGGGHRGACGFMVPSVSFIEGRMHVVFISKGVTA